MCILGTIRASIAFIDFASPVCACASCGELPVSVPETLAAVESVPLHDLPRLRNSRPDIVLVRTHAVSSLLEKTQTLRSLWPQSAFASIFCSHDLGAADLRLCYSLGLEEFLCCPVHPADLVARVEHILRRRQSVAAAKGNVIVASQGLRRVLDLVPVIARSTATVLVVGETGTGKELLARTIHYQSPRKGSPFVPVNCGAMPDQLLENELFGHSRGAFTDASSPEEGLVAEAEGGTLFLDEIDSLSASAQAKILRLLQDGEYRPLGTSKTRYANIRIITATNADLHQKVGQHAFREDLYHRLNVLKLHLPPLRERPEDIPALVEHFLAKYESESVHGPLTVAPGALQRLMRHNWPGNVRELEKTIQRATILAPAPVLEAAHIELLEDTPSPSIVATTFHKAKQLAIRSFEQVYLSELLTTHAGNVSRAARAAGKERRSFQRLLRKYSLDAGAYACGSKTLLP